MSNHASGKTTVVQSLRGLLLVMTGVATMALPGRAFAYDCGVPQRRLLIAQEESIHEQQKTLHMCSAEDISLQKRLIALDDQIASSERGMSGRCQEFNAQTIAGNERLRAAERDRLNKCLARGVPQTEAELAARKKAADEEMATRDKELEKEYADRANDDAVHREHRAPPPVNRIPDDNPFAAPKPTPQQPKTAAARPKDDCSGEVTSNGCVPSSPPPPPPPINVTNAPPPQQPVASAGNAGSGNSKNIPTPCQDLTGSAGCEGGGQVANPVGPPSSPPPNRESSQQATGGFTVAVPSVNDLGDAGRTVQELLGTLPDHPDPSVSSALGAPKAMPPAALVKRADAPNPDKGSFPASLPELCGGGFDTFTYRTRDENGPFDSTCVVAKNNCHYPVRFRYRLSKTTLCPNATYDEITNDPNNIIKCTVDNTVGPMTKDGKLGKSDPVCTNTAEETISNYGVYKPR
jgi:hypothetical protein